MGKIGLVSCLLFFLFAAKSFGQRGFSKRGMTKIGAAYSLGYFTKASDAPHYVHGHISYYAEDHISLRLDGYVFLGNNSKIGKFSNNHSFLFGGLFHFTESRVDTYMGIQPGINFSSIDFYDENHGQSYKSDISVSPVMSVTTGINFYIENNVNLFASTRYLFGNFLKEYPSTISLSEIRFSAGLGFNIQSRSKYPSY